jgi:hypothetical protein
MMMDGVSNRLEVIGLTIDEQAFIYDNQLEDCYNNPRFYLDNFEYWTEYRVSWIDYKHTKITLPYKSRKARTFTRPTSL